MSNSTTQKPHPKTLNPTKPPTTKTTPRSGPAPLRRIPPPDHRENRRHRGGCRCCCLWLLWAVLVTAALLVLAALTATAFYAVYRPRPPSFSLSSLKFTHLNLTTGAAELNLTITTTNPNEKITFLYDLINVTIHAHHGKIIIGRGFFPQFVHLGKNTTSLFAEIENKDGDYLEDLGDKTMEILRSDLKNKKGLDLKVRMETHMRVKIGGERMGICKFGLRASCYGVNAFADFKGNLTDESSVKTRVDDAKCKVHFIFNIFEWEISI